MTKVLLVEDNFTLRRLYSRTLRRGGLNVSQAESLQSARDLMAANTFDVVVCDIQLTDGVATDFLTELSKDGVPVIAMSSDDSYRITCDDLGIETFMQKPIPTRKLVPAVESIVGEPKPRPKKHAAAV